MFVHWRSDCPPFRWTIEATRITSLLKYKRWKTRQSTPFLFGWLSLLSREGRAAWKLGPGSLAGEYVLRSVVGLGGHGAVYEAEHRILGRRAAVKVLHSHLTDKDEMLQRFVREAQVIHKIRHPNIVDIYDFGVLPDGSPYYVMELLPARTLSQLLLERGRFIPGPRAGVPGAGLRRAGGGPPRGRGAPGSEGEQRGGGLRWRAAAR